MTNKVTVTADQNGNIIGVSQNNPEYGYVRVEQNVTQIDQRGWLKNVKRSTLIKGTVADLTASGFKAGTQLPGKIVVIESLTPFNTDNPERDLKIAGDSGIICRIDDQPIYRQTFYTPDVNAGDELIMHNNTDEIREVMEASRALAVLNSQKPAETQATL
jgi:hypothetical protein